MGERTRRAVIKGGSAAIAGFGVLGSVGTASAASGTLSITVYADEVVDGVVQSTPFEGVTVSDGAWENAAWHLGETDESGYLEAALDASQHELDLFKSISSKTVSEKRDVPVTVEAGETAVLEAHMAPETAEITAHATTEWGEALYVTGQTEFLGNWESAYKMTPEDGVWTFEDNLPLGAEYKIVKDDWVDAGTISTGDVTWETGPNHTIEEEYAFYKLLEDVYPTF